MEKHKKPYEVIGDVSKRLYEIRNHIKNEEYSKLLISVLLDDKSDKDKFIKVKYALKDSPEYYTEIVITPSRLYELYRIGLERV